MATHDAASSNLIQTVDSLTVRSIAVEADTDVRSVQKRLRGERVRGRAGERIDAVLARRGLRAQRAA